MMEEIIAYIEEKKIEREEVLSGLEMTDDERAIQDSILLGVDMVMRWLREK